MRSANRGHSDFGRSRVPRLKTSRWRGPLAVRTDSSRRWQVYERPLRETLSWPMNTCTKDTESDRDGQKTF